MVKAVLSKLSPARRVVALYLAAILLGGFLLCLPFCHADGRWAWFDGGIFASVSAISGTGILTHAMNLSGAGNGLSLFGQIVLLLLIQVGGIGCMGAYMALVLVAGKKISLASRMALEEVSVQGDGGGAVRGFKQMLLYAAVAEAVGALLLTFSFVPAFGWGRGVYYSVFTAVSAFCTAGFDVAGLASFAGDAWVNFVLIVLMLLGGIGYFVIREIPGLFKRRRLSFFAKVALFMTGVLTCLSFVIYLSLEWNNGYAGLNAGEKMLAALFQSVSASGAGFSTVGQNALTASSRLWTYFIMFVGVCPASTGSGIKVTTLFVILSALGSTAAGEKAVTIRKKTIGADTIKKAVAVLGISLIAVAVSTFISEIDGSASDGSRYGFAECLSAFTNAGIYPADGFYAVKPLQNIVLCVAMLMGRVGMLTVATAIGKNRGNGSSVKYTDARLLIG